MIQIIIAMRFLLEVVTVLALIATIFFKPFKLEKLFFLAFAVLVVWVWSIYGAPNSPKTLTGNKRLILELGVFSLSSLFLMRAYSFKVGGVYLLLCLINLSLIYLLQL